MICVCSLVKGFRLSLFFLVFSDLHAFKICYINVPTDVGPLEEPNIVLDVVVDCCDRDFVNIFNGNHLSKRKGL